MPSGPRFTTWSSGHTISGANKSTTVTTAEQTAEFPLPSFANTLTVTGVPISVQETSCTSTVTAPVPQLSSISATNEGVIKATPS